MTFTTSAHLLRLRVLNGSYFSYFPQEKTLQILTIINYFKIYCFLKELFRLWKIILVTCILNPLSISNGILFLNIHRYGNKRYKALQRKHVLRSKILIHRFKYNLFDEWEVYYELLGHARKYEFLYKKFNSIHKRALIIKTPHIKRNWKNIVKYWSQDVQWYRAKKKLIFTTKRGTKIFEWFRKPDYPWFDVKKYSSKIAWWYWKKKKTKRWSPEKKKMVKIRLKKHKKGKHSFNSLDNTTQSNNYYYSNFLNINSHSKILFLPKIGTEFVLLHILLKKTLLAIQQKRNCLRPKQQIFTYSNTKIKHFFLNNCVKPNNLSFFKKRKEKSIHNIDRKFEKLNFIIKHDENALYIYFKDGREYTRRLKRIEKSKKKAILNFRINHLFRNFLRNNLGLNMISKLKQSIKSVFVLKYLSRRARKRLKALKRGLPRILRVKLKKGLIIAWLAKKYFTPQIYIDYFAKQFINVHKRRQYLFLAFFKKFFSTSLSRSIDKWKYHYVFSISGKINNSRRKRTWTWRSKKNRLGLQNLHKSIKYCATTGKTVVGAFGFKFWLQKITL